MKERDERYPFDEDLVVDDVCAAIGVDSGPFSPERMDAAAGPIRDAIRNWIRNAEEAMHD